MIFIVLIVAVLCMVVANYMSQRQKNRRQEEHERRIERFERLMETLKKVNSDQEVQGSRSLSGDTRDDDKK